jgi:hypothetical protein
MWVSAQSSRPAGVVPAAGLCLPVDQMDGHGLASLGHGTLDDIRRGIPADVFDAAHEGATAGGEKVGL